MTLFPIHAYIVDVHSGEVLSYAMENGQAWLDFVTGAATNALFDSSSVFAFEVKTERTILEIHDGHVTSVGESDPLATPDVFPERFERHMRDYRRCITRQVLTPPSERI